MQLSATSSQQLSRPVETTWVQPIADSEVLITQYLVPEAVTPQPVTSMLWSTWSAVYFFLSKGAAPRGPSGKISGANDACRDHFAANLCKCLYIISNIIKSYS
jgi:hypothetical protein